jgi:hypothetical protein
MAFDQDSTFEVDRTMRNKKLLLGLVATAAALTSSLAQAFNPPPFPRIGALVFVQNYDDSAFEAKLAKTSIAIMTYWPGWGNGRARTFEQSVEAIKAINPNFQAFIYAIQNEVGQGNASGGYQQAWWNELSSANSWAYSNGAGGSKAMAQFQGGGGPFYETNTTLFGPRDANGDRWIDYIAKWVASNDGTANPGIAGIFTDNVSWKPLIDADWNRDGSIDSQNDATVQQWYRQGYVGYFNTLKANMPGKYQIGNMADWTNPGANLTEYNQQLNGGLMEGIVGYSWSIESWGGWKQMMAGYRTSMANSAAPKLVMFHQSGNGSSTDYQSMRYGLASCLMDDGYFVFNASTGENDLPWFDEYDAKLGVSTSSPPTAAWQKGVYRRDFSNGIALVNPKGNGAQTVTLETTFIRLSGSQNPSVNNGAHTQTITLQDRDGILLLRTAPQTVSTPASSPVPSAPKIINVQ